MKLVKLISLFLFGCSTLYAQENFTCETEPVDSATYFSWPWFGNNQYLLDLVDSLENPRNKTTSQQANYLHYIPVTAWVHHQGTNLGDNISDVVVEQYINSVNDFMQNNSSLIRFYLTCSVNHVTNSAFYDVPNAGVASNMFSTHHSANSLNIHFPFSSDVGGRGRAPWNAQGNVIYTCYIRTGSTINQVRIQALVHEIGHALGLLHTHNSRSNGHEFNRDCGNCYQESVSRTHTQGAACVSTIGKKKCEVNGDCLCDTDADPGLIRDFANLAPLVNNNCEYDPQNTGWVNDNWGNAWNNNGSNNSVINIMSYSSTQCVTTMSTSQRGVEYFYMQQKHALPGTPNHSSFYNNTWVDVYENDNHSENAREIFLEQCHEKTFHTIPSSNPDVNDGTICDVDWVIFRPTISGYYNIYTDYYHWTTDKADTKITLYENACNGCPLVYKGVNDNISSTDKRSRLSNRYMLSNFWYYIKIENGASTPTNGFYLVCVNEGENPGYDDPVETEIRMYPNPATVSSVVECDGCPINGVRVYDRNGHLVHETNLSTPVSSYELNVSGYQPGQYIVHVLVESTWQALTLVVQ